MEHKKALIKLSESADLLRMLEDLTNPALNVQLSPAAFGGLRITLRNVRDTILNSHDVLSVPEPVRQDIARQEQARYEQQPRQDFARAESIADRAPRRSLHQEVAREEVGGDVDGVEFVTKTNTGYAAHNATSLRRPDMRGPLGKIGD